MTGNGNPDEARAAMDETIERAAAEDTDPLTLLETEDALSSIPDRELSRSSSPFSRSLRSSSSPKSSS